MAWGDEVLPFAGALINGEPAPPVPPKESVYRKFRSSSGLCCYLYAQDELIAAGSGSSCVMAAAVVNVRRCCKCNKKREHSAGNFKHKWPCIQCSKGMKGYMDNYRQLLSSGTDQRHE
jgi:hypothetical protein